MNQIEATHFSQVPFKLGQLGPTDLAEMGLGVPQSAFNSVGVYFNKITCFNIPVEGFEGVLVYHCEVPVTLTIQVTVGAPPVAVDGRPWSYMALDNRQEGGARTIVDRIHDEGVASSFHHAKDPNI